MIDWFGRRRKELEEENLALRVHLEHSDRLIHLLRQKEIDFFRNQLQPLLSGVGRLIARSDANFALQEDELTTEEGRQRLEQSARVGEEVIARLKAEDAARRHTVGES